MLKPLLLVCLLLSPAISRAEDRCSDTADKALFKTSSWSDLRKWFERYPDCDDGYLAEGVSDITVSWLARHWNDLPRLERQIRRNSVAADGKTKISVLDAEGKTVRELLPDS